MERRGFLKLLGLGATGMVLDPERLLWVPGQKTIFLPPVSSGNTLLTVDWITVEAMRVLSQQLAAIKWVNRTYEDTLTTGLRAGVPIRVR